MNLRDARASVSCNIINCSSWWIILPLLYPQNKCLQNKQVKKHRSKVMWLLTLCWIPLCLMSKQQWCDPFPWASARGIMGLGSTMARAWTDTSGSAVLHYHSPLMCLFIHSTCQCMQTGPFLSHPLNIMHYSIISAFLLDCQQDYHHKYSTKAQGSYIDFREPSAAVFSLFYKN